MTEEKKKKIWEVCVVLIDEPPEGIDMFTEDEIEREVRGAIMTWIRTQVNGVMLDEINTRELDE